MDRSPGFEFHFASFSRHARRARSCLAIETDGSELARFCPAFSSAAQFNLKGRSGWFGSPTLYAGSRPHAMKVCLRFVVEVWAPCQSVFEGLGFFA
jgi:hypothetical protein